MFQQLLEVDEAARLGTQGSDAIKNHSWFSGFDWNGIYNGTFPVPQEITSRIDLYLENHAEDIVLPASSALDGDELNTPEWLENW